MATTIELLSKLFAVMAVLPAGVLLGQAILALRPRKDVWQLDFVPTCSCAVVVPAHNEQSHIRQTIKSILSNAPQARIVVVADNCSDETAQIASRAGAEVTQRQNSTQLGKAYALGHAVAYLQSHSPPDVVIVVDADARVKGRSLESLAGLAHLLNRPVQSLNVIDRCRGGKSLSALTILGNRLHNVVRPLAMQRLGFPCLLMGSGMAFPWQAVQRVGLDNASLGEDKRLGLDMMLAGYPPAFCLETKVASPVAEHGKGYLGQRMRWEQGHLLVAAWAAPRLVWHALREKNLGSLAVAIDLTVPPIALIAAIWMVATVLALVVYQCYDGRWPLVGVVAAAMMMCLTLMITWLGFARRRVSASSLIALPRYLISKLPIYVSLLTQGPQRIWRRTERTAERKMP